MKRLISIIALSLLVVLIVMFLAAIDPVIGALVTCLPLGWWHFLSRNLERVSLNWSVVGMGIVCSAVALCLGNALLRTLYREVQLDAGGTPPKPWRFKWTLGGYLGLWLLFAISFAGGGIYRHGIWLMAEKQPWYHERDAGRHALAGADMATRMLLVDDPDIASARKAFASAKNPRHSAPPLAEDFTVIFYANSTNAVEAYVIVPRKHELLSPPLFCVSINGSRGEMSPMSQLQRTLSELDAKYHPTSSGDGERTRGN